MKEEKRTDEIVLAWRNKDAGMALKWWCEALVTPGVIQTYLERPSYDWDADC